MSLLGILIASGQALECVLGGGSSGTDVTDICTAPCTAIGSIGVRSTDGSVFRTENNGANPADIQTLTGPCTVSDFEAQIVVVGSAPTSGDVTGSFLALSSQREWIWAGASLNATYTLTIREIADTGNTTVFTGTIDVDEE